MSPPQPSWKQEFKHDAPPAGSPAPAATPESVEPAPESPEKKEE